MHFFSFCSNIGIIIVYGKQTCLQQGIPNIIILLSHGFTMTLWFQKVHCQRKFGLFYTVCWNKKNYQLNIFKCQKINDILTIVKNICHVSLNFHFFKNFCTLWTVWQSNHIASLKTAMLYQKWARQLLTKCINWHKNSQLLSPLQNKEYQILSAGIYILWLYQYHDSAIHPQRSGLNLTEYLQHFLQT